jgi:alpha-L-arabinofuranosidase
VQLELTECSKEEKKPVVKVRVHYQGKEYEIFVKWCNQAMLEKMIGVKIKGIKLNQMRIIHEREEVRNQFASRSGRSGTSPRRTTRRGSKHSRRGPSTSQG